MNPDKIIRKLRENPTKTLDNARRGSLMELTEIANFWQQVPRLLSLGILDIFFLHLNPDKTPTNPSPANSRSQLADRAFMSLLGLTKAGNFLGDGADHSQAIIKAWPGIFTWSAFFFAAHVQSTGIKPEVRRSAIDVITAAWYSISRIRNVREVMVPTKGSIEIATQLWTLEDAGPLPSVIDIPGGSATLDALLRDAKTPSLDRVVAAAGGKAENIASMALSRLRVAIKGPHIREPHATIYLDLIGHLSRQPEHPLRHALLSANIISLSTKIAVTVSKMLDAGQPGLLDVMVAAFGYLANCLESTDGFTWVSHSINAGLLQAFNDASPHFSKLDPEDCDMVLSIVRDILPKYLVYRSVVHAVDGSMLKLQNSPNKERILGTLAKEVWLRFHGLAVERLMVTIHAKVVKGKAATCDNVKCQKVDAKNNFQKCASCSTTLYCSKECQVIAWKEGGHKDMCKMKVQERREGKLQSISKQDAAFFHHLSTRDAGHHLPHLRRLAAQDFPDIPMSGLIACIDYTVHPAKYSVIPIEGYERYQLETSGSSNAEARNEALIERARDNPGKFTLIQSKIANGQSLQLVMTVVTGDFWKGIGLSDEEWVEGDGSESDDSEDRAEDRGTAIDVVDMMLARSTLNGLMQKFGERPMF